MDLMAAGDAPDARIFGMDGEVLAAGRDEIRALFSDAYERNPTLHYEIQTRIEVGPFVIDEERISGFSEDGSRFVRRSRIALKVGLSPRCDSLADLLGAWVRTGKRSCFEAR